MDFFSALAEAASIPELVASYDRLYGAHFCRVINAKGLDRMIDRSTGFACEETAKFAEFFYEYVWSRLPDECFKESA